MDGKRGSGSAESVPVLPFESSVGYQIRLTHRLLQRYLHQKIAPHGVTLGMWYFLRALWQDDGLTQRELSTIVGTMEPTTLNAIKAMETSGLVHRIRNDQDRRKVNVFLTARGRQLEKQLMPLAIDVVEAAVEGFTPSERGQFLASLSRVQRNLAMRIDEPAAPVNVSTARA